MKIGKLFNSEISSVISQMGHTDSLVIGDAGLPIPSAVKRIDIALTAGFPPFLKTLEVVLIELCVQKCLLASEISQENPEMEKNVIKAIQSYEKERGFKVVVEYCPQEKLKEMTALSKAVVRTGETTPYSNIILFSGVTF